ncbi:hypothetical protein HDU86_003413 [Geranomyces michiganensis]|nr:hypothetical protein HDU86_003413 [Geranomyces michiganensis]
MSAAAATSRKAIIVTGASRGLGLAVVQSLLESKARVLGVSRSSLAASPALARLAQDHPAAYTHLSEDVADDTAAARIVDACVSAYGQVDGVVHNAGLLASARLATAPLTQVRTAFDVNFFAALALAQRALPYLRPVCGRFIVVSSGAAVNAYAGWGAYCTSKAACNMLVAGLGVEEEDVISVALRPGVVDTEMQAEIRTRGKEAMGDANHGKFVNLHSSGKLLPPDVPGTVIANLALKATKELSGRFLSWDDKDLAAYQKSS